jgi:protein TonB
LKRKLIALLSSILGTAFVLFGLVVMNRPENDQKRVKKSVSIDRTEVIKKKPAPPPLKRPTPPPPPKVAPPVTASLTGQSFGISSFDSLGQLPSSLLGDLSQVSMDEQTVDIPPRSKEKGSLNYPSGAREKGLEGHVVVSMLINQFGSVEKGQILESNPEGVFEQAALEAIRHWRFEPGSYQGRPVKVWVRQRIVFGLN